MFQHILVPLDGSKRAESAIPVAANIARATGGSLLFVRVVSVSSVYAFYSGEPFVLPPDIPATDYQTTSAASYLVTIAQGAELSGITVQTKVLTGVPAQQILWCIEEQAIDLVVLCSRGETGLKRWVLGSVAQKVLRHSSAPVLVLHESAGILSSQHPAGRRPVRILVALDGSALAETALEPAAALSAALSAPEQGTLHLVQVLPLAEPANATEALSDARQLDLSVGQTSLRETVEAWQEKCEKTGSPALETSVIVHPDVAESLIRMAEEGVPATEESEARQACDVVALATHGRSGPARWVMGSIAERVLDGTRLPLLVVRASWPAKHYPHETRSTQTRTPSQGEHP